MTKLCSFSGGRFLALIAVVTIVIETSTTRGAVLPNSSLPDPAESTRSSDVLATGKSPTPTDLDIVEPSMSPVVTATTTTPSSPQPEDDDDPDEDDESFMSGTSIGDSPTTISNSDDDVAPTNTSSVCDGVTCDRNRSCMPDASYKHGYRCCRIKAGKCKESAGRFCDDPGQKDYDRRTPLVRKRRKFKPGERIFFYCKDSISTDAAAVCQENGTWVYDPVDNPCFLPVYKIPYGISPPSPTIRTQVDQKTPEKSTTSSRDKWNIVLIVLFVCLLMFFLFVSVPVIRKRCSISSPPHSIRNEKNGGGGGSESMHKAAQPAPMPDLMSSSVSIDDFQSYVTERHNGSDFLFLQEFQAIQNESSSHQYTTEASNLMENVEKNRYNNIVAYDHTRVHLKDLKKQNTPFDYINANYVSGFTDLQAFIACQGPLPSTFSDFWEMVWTNNVSVIVMITNLIENGRRKCDQYWPSEGKEVYKNISVSAKTTEAFANHTIRTFIIKNNKLTKRPKACERKVVQYHYTQWPDHGTPDYILPVLSFIAKSSSGDQTAPIVVHCSAGVGRTGTYIAIQSMIQMLKTTGSVNIPTFLRHIRTQRNHLVQTQDQYVFVHDAVLEYIKVGHTELKRKELLGYYHHLLKTIKTNKENKAAGESNKPSPSTSTKKNIIEKQFDHMKSHLEVMVDNNFATRTVNRNKNRQGALLPVFKSCVRLRDNHSSEEGSEYINASYLQGYRNSMEFIVTQLPMEDTRKDFWQLVWDTNCSVIVTLADKEWSEEDDSYWPTQDNPSQLSSFKVSFSQVEDSNNVIQRTFVLEATKDDYVLMVKQFHIKQWNEQHPSPSNADVVAMVSTYAATKEGPTIVQDRFGGTSAAQFACWTSMHDRLGHEDTVDVYQSAVLACQMRPGVFTTFDHLLYLYQVAVMEAQTTKTSSSSHHHHTNGTPSSPVQTSSTNGVTNHKPPFSDINNCSASLNGGEEAVTLLTFSKESA